MKTVGVNEAKRQFIVTRHGRPFARLCAGGHKQAYAAAVIEEIYRFRREHRPTLGGVLICEPVEEDRE